MDLRDIFDSFFNRNDNSFEKKRDFQNDFNDFESELSPDFEDIFKNFGQMFEVLNGFSVFNDINDSNGWSQLNSESKSPRDLMLKSNDQIIRHDIDLEERVRRRGLDSIFNDKHKSESNAIKIPVETKSLRKSYFYSSLNNNGRFEEQKTTTDHFGNVETSVTKRIGDQSFTQITKRNNKNQIIETKEVVDNLDLNELNLFKQRFIQMDSNENPRNEMISNNNNNNNNKSFLKKIFDFWSLS